MKIIIDEASVEYQFPQTIGELINANLSRWLRTIATFIPTVLPYRYKSKIKAWFGVPNISEVGKSIKLEPKKLEENFVAHEKQLKVYGFLSTVIYFSLAFILGGGLIVLAAYANLKIQAFYHSSFILDASNIIFIFIGLLSAIVAAKIVGVLLNRTFADSLILPSSLFLVIDLYQDGDLSNPEFRRHILERIRILRRNTLLLSQTFTTPSIDNNQEAVSQLRSIETYIREREGWVIAPKKNTLSLLRKDFDKLAVILISGQYGEFKSSTKRKPKETASPNPPSFGDKVLSVIFTLFPYGILAVLYFAPDLILRIGIEANVTFLIAIAWILLSIDARLKLGLVERVTGLAKTMKELR
ncbi:MAG: hypothetical protein U0X74_02775 [Anaerolineales bacterium]